MMSYQPPPQFQQPLQPQQGQYPYQQPGFYQQTPPQPPPKSPKRKWSRGRIILVVIAVILVMGAIGGILQALGISKPDTTATTTQDTPTTSTSQATTAPTHVATTAPTQKPTAAPARLVVTHGKPHLGGNISDFYGKFVTQTISGVSAGSAPNNQPSESVSWVTDSNNGYAVTVQYYTSTHIVYYIDYTGDSNWSKAQYRDYLINNFAPPNTVEDTALNQSWQAGGGDPYNPIIYNTSVGKIALHISDGDGNMNTI